MDLAFLRRPYLFNKAHLQDFSEVLQAWMISQIPCGAEGLDQLVCDGKILRGYGRLQMELEWLKKNLSCSDAHEPGLIKSQAELSA